MTSNREIQHIIHNVFGDVKNYLQSDQLQIDCPLCQERDGLSHGDGKKNLEINTELKKFKCWKCDFPPFAGGLGRLIKTYGSYSDYQIYVAIAGNDKYESKIEDEFEYNYHIELPPEYIPFTKVDMLNPLHFEAYNYMIVNRKFSKDILVKYHIGFCLTGFYKNRIIIPSFDRFGTINYFISRTYDNNEKKMKYKNPKIDKNKIIFNEGLINWDSTVYIVEGLFEALTLENNAIPLLGKTISDLLLFKLKYYKPNVIVILDPDAYVTSIDLLQKIKTIYSDCDDSVKIVKLPSENDYDLDEIRNYLGINEVIKELYQARDLNVDDYFLKKMNYSGYTKNNKFHSYLDKKYETNE